MTDEAASAPSASPRRKSCRLAGSKETSAAVKNGAPTRRVIRAFNFLMVSSSRARTARHEEASFANMRPTKPGFSLAGFRPSDFPSFPTSPAAAAAAAAVTTTGGHPAMMRRGAAIKDLTFSIGAETMRNSKGPFSKASMSSSHENSELLVVLLQ